MTGTEHYCLINNIYKDRKLLKRREFWKSHIRAQRPSRLWLSRLTNQWSAVVLPISIRSVCEVPQQNGYKKTGQHGTDFLVPLTYFNHGDAKMTVPTLNKLNWTKSDCLVEMRLNIVTDLYICYSVDPFLKPHKTHCGEFKDSKIQFGTRFRRTHCTLVQLPLNTGYKKRTLVHIPVLALSVFLLRGQRKWAAFVMSSGEAGRLYPPLCFCEIWFTHVL